MTAKDNLCLIFVLVGLLVMFETHFLVLVGGLRLTEFICTLNPFSS